jgi:hypothetical protein
MPTKEIIGNPNKKIIINVNRELNEYLAPLFIWRISHGFKIL